MFCFSVELPLENFTMSLMLCIRINLLLSGVFFRYLLCFVNQVQTSQWSRDRRAAEMGFSTDWHGMSHHAHETW